MPGNLGTVRLLHASTTTGDRSVEAESGVAQVTLTVPGAPVITADVLTSEASGDCEGGTPQMTSSSHVLRVSVGDTVIEPVPDQREISLGPAGTLWLNQTVTAANQRTQRALFLDTPVGEIAVAESMVDIHGNPCAAAGPDDPQCSDGVDNEDPEDQLADQADPGCHDDGDASNPDSYNPDDDNEADTGGGCPPDDDGDDDGDDDADDSDDDDSDDDDSDDSDDDDSDDSDDDDSDDSDQDDSDDDGDDDPDADDSDDSDDDDSDDSDDDDDDSDDDDDCEEVATSIQSLTSR